MSLTSLQEMKSLLKTLVHTNLYDDYFRYEYSGVDKFYVKRTIIFLVNKQYCFTYTFFNQR